ncbi:MAG: RNA polymerase sigma-70 factor (ECF subfamily) [Rhodothermales bacterium]|jgi:RNA polymerase sigma-70 factor (ECF subfamily)
MPNPRNSGMLSTVTALNLSMTPDPTRVDDALIRRCMDGDDTAFDRLVELTKSQIYAVAFRYVRDAHLAFDMVQEAYIRFYKFLPQWDFSCQVTTWLYRVVSNLCIDNHRRGKRRGLVLMDDWSENPPEIAAKATETPGAQLQKHEQRAAIEALPERQQQAFRLKYIAGLSLQEISEIQACAIGTVKASIFQASQKLRKQFRHED